jgi:hypothetical protein
MIEVLKFKAEHMAYMKEQQATAYLKTYTTPEQDKLLENTLAHTIVSRETKRVLMCAGVVEYWPGRGEAWAIFDEKCKSEFIYIHGAVKKFLEICPVKRIEAAVDIGFEAGHRWVKALGFELEAPLLKSYRPVNGGDVSLYARVG